ncbi:hypothetical protein [Anaerotignum sp.]|uniref:hypothetical protein n=1 Tax=Anaerotignum sp. TaxID=2039241 RepID=UPI0028981B88|nr:hypothetical protein [Anaerotignum sp.]
MASFDGSIRIDTKIDSMGFNSGLKSINAGLAGITKALKGVAIAAGIAFGVKALVDYNKTAVSASTELSNALIGLQSIMDGQGRSFKNAKKFVDEYISDGLVPATNAINAYKNLALRGYDDSQIQKVLIALKDSAAFGRQSSYTLGQAVETATEGLKNENSILVDNAGVTKNVAKMWQDYAKSIGTTSNNLTQQQKIQAEVNGILEETKFQVGDAAKIADSFSGRVLQLQFSLNNLKIAIGNALTPIISKIIPPIKELVDWLTVLANKFAQISAMLFGKVVNVNTKTADSAASAASSTEELAGATKDAGNAAEKAGKQAKSALANFDELNVIAKQDTSSGDGGAADIGGGISTDVITDEIGTDTEISPKLLASLDRLKELMEPAIEAAKRLWEELKRLGGFVWDGLKDFYDTFLVPVGKWILGEGLPRFFDIIANGLSKIDWQKINDALHELWEALTPFAINIGEGLLWMLENVFVPLGVWAMNNIVPLVIEGIAAAIEILNGTIDALKPLGIWLWENLLKPIAEWTGGVIVTILELLVGALQGISDWITENQGLVQGMAIIVGLFFAAWEIATLGEFIICAGGVVGALNALITALRAATIAKIADKAETLYLVGLYAKDFIAALAANVVNLAKETAAWIASTAAKVANTTSQLAMTAATTAWNAICVVATTVTTAFGAAVAFLTSPIGLVVLAIGALIAIIVLLVQNWDTVKTKASEAWQWITEQWGDFSDWFEKEVWSPFKQGLKDFGNFFIKIINGMISGFEGFVNYLISGINKIIDGFNEISFSVPDWVPGIGGKTWGFNLNNVQSVKLGRVPMLATGAVIPPNQEFLAVLGDQKSGRNLEAPEGLIRQIMREELAGLGATDGGSGTTVILELDKREIGRTFLPIMKKEESRVGVSLRVGGVL